MHVLSGLYSDSSARLFGVFLSMLVPLIGVLDLLGVLMLRLNRGDVEIIFSLLLNCY